MMRVMAFVGARLPDQLAQRFDALASARGGKSRLLRLLIEQAVGASADGVAPAAGRGTSRKITVSLRPEDLGALDEAARRLGMRRTEWLVALARSRLGNRPEFNREEALALIEARRELRRISVLLRELTADGRTDGAVALDVDALRAEVRGHLEDLRRAIEGRQTYWGNLK